MIKKLLGILAALLVLLLILPVALPSQVRVARSIDVNVPADKAHAFLVDLYQFGSWSPFQQEDPTQKVDIQGSGVGSFLTWKGEKTGEGKMTIVALEPNRSVSHKMEFFAPMKGEGNSTWETTAVGDAATQVTWAFEQELPYFQRYFGLMMDSMLGGHFQMGLEALKKKLEE